jgi:hypothetical protein
MSISDLFINGSLDDFKIYSKKWDWNKCLKYACKGEGFLGIIKYKGLFLK